MDPEDIPGDSELQECSDSSYNSIEKTPQFISTVDIPVDSIQLGRHWNLESYPAWTCEEVPTRLIAEIVTKAQKLLGFQFDASVNAFELLMSQLDSRASRSTPEIALRSLHADYIAAPHANYKKWYFASSMDVVDMSSKCEGADGCSLDDAQDIWQLRLQDMTSEECLTDVVIYLLCWTEANQIRYMPECLAFIYKCARDFYQHALTDDSVTSCPTHFFLDSVISPIYNCYVAHNYELTPQGLLKRERDHRQTIGYDDINQLFWYLEGIKRLECKDRVLINENKERRYLLLGDVDWNAAIKKTYRETRTWAHATTNFSRILILHLSAFWYYTAFNAPTLYTKGYSYRLDQSPVIHIQVTTVALGGAIGPILSITALIGELCFVPRSFPGSQPVIPRLMIVTVLLSIVVAPSICIYVLTSWDEDDMGATVVSGVQLAISIILSLYFSVQPLSSILGSTYKATEREFLANEYFTSSYQPLSKYNTVLSWSMSALILFAKLTESYFFLTLSIRDPLYELSIMNLSESCLGDVWLGARLCAVFPKLLLCTVLVLEMVLFFLDTYLWYVIINATFSVVISFFLGASIWTPWRNIYTRLPHRISSKLLTDKKSVAIKIIWNAIVQDMAYNHLISRDKARELMYSKKYDPQLESHTVIEPIFFTAEEDGSNALPSKEAQRRISFFAQSLAQTIPEPMLTEQMPGFSVLIPHYSEKIALSLKETIKHENGRGKVTVLEYLQKLYPTDWQHFVEQNKRDARIVSVDSYDTFTQQNELVISILGFCTSKAMETNKTRLWCSERAQTLYRTVAGFMNYQNAIKLLHYSESDQFHTPNLKLMSGVDNLVNRKFRLIVAMQRYASFSKEQLEDVELLFGLFPDIKIAYIECDAAGDKPAYYSSYIDSTCEPIDGRRVPKYRIKLSGNPILGDGKSDNQNHAIIFYRGEYIQLIDSNQDNYIEECLKIRNTLAEFEEFDLSPMPYKTLPHGKVAIVGAREYIFSENIGVLGDVAAGKEQTFGTLFARTLAKVGGKLHYGHPDFLNGIFMTTRGGVSKAQKGLHLNEDIYAGIMALCRGGRIKHTEYIQCGKGRDLGFVSILNFTTKIGAGMAEQFLSREYFWLGTKLPFDRFMSFYYGHPGFHLNNVAIVTSIELFLTILTWLAALNGSTKHCKITRGTPKTQLRLPPGCINIEPLQEWITRCISSIAMVFLIAQLPLFIQELSEKGLTKSLKRITKHFCSLSMLFEIFVCQIYASAFSGDLSLGGAKYISTGRGFATTRTPLHILFEGYSTQSIYFGTRSFAVLVYISIVFWHPPLLWFWLTSIALCLSPTIFNPHQFNKIEFFLDYRKTLLWFISGDGWAKHVRSRRAKVTGLYFRGNDDGRRPSMWKLVTSELLGPMISVVLNSIPYIFISSQRQARFQKLPTRNPILHLLVLGGASLGADMVAVLLGSLGVMWAFFYSDRQVAIRVLSAITYGLGFVLHIGIYYVLFMVNKRDFPSTILGIMALGYIERLLLKFLTTIIGRQMPAEMSSDAWWTGHWGAVKQGLRFWVVPLEETLCKLCECTLFSLDFMVIHFLIALQLPLVAIPRIDDIHSIFLLWLSPSQSLPVPIRQARQQQHQAVKYAVACVVVVATLGVVLALPMLFPSVWVMHVRLLRVFS